VDKKQPPMVERRTSPWREIVAALDSLVEAAESQGDDAEGQPAAPRKHR
jgi:hypothetical protein